MDDFILLFIPSSYKQTSEWRNKQLWYNGSLSCENYQVFLIKKYLNIDLYKTQERINHKNKIINELHPLLLIEGLEYSENFDRKYKFKNKVFYFNFKMICSAGGSQTRSIREVYNFINKQLIYLTQNINKNIYFINILDGKFCNRFKKNFEYLLSKNEYKNIFIGDSREFIFWWNIMDPL